MYRFLIFFLIFSFLGWICEVTYSAYKHSKFINRGFLDGPICPIYGFGVAFIYLTVNSISSLDWVVVLASFLLPTILELFTGFIMEKLFKHKWWDYSDQRFNLKGYICFKFSVLWGLVCVFVVKIIFPLMDKLISVLPYKPTYIISWILVGVVLLDTLGSLFAIIGINKKLKALDLLNDEIHIGSDKLGEKVCDNTLNLIDAKNKIVSKMSFLHKHIINAFPNMKSRKFKSLEELKESVRKNNNNK